VISDCVHRAGGARGEVEGFGSVDVDAVFGGSTLGWCAAHAGDRKYEIADRPKGALVGL